MYIHRININGINYEFVIKNNTLAILKYKNGIPTRLNFKFTKDAEKTRVAEEAIDNILTFAKEEIEDKLKKGEYKNTNEIEKDLTDKIGAIKVPELKQTLEGLNIENSEEYREILKYLFKRFETQNKSLQQKEEIIEKNIDVDLKTLFKENGITEYEVNSTTAVITYFKNGIPYTINHTNSSQSIYEIITSQLALDKVNSKEEINQNIKNAMETETQYHYTENETLNSTAELDIQMQSVADYLKDNYGINEIHGIRPADNKVEGMLMVNLGGDNWQPIFATKDQNGRLNITFGEEKQINSKSQPTTTLTTIENQMIEELDTFSIENQIIEIYQKLLEEIDLSEDEEKVVEYYKQEENFNTLSEEAQANYLGLLEIYENLQKERNPELTKANGKIKKLEPPQQPPLQEAAFIQTVLVTFISGLVTGIFVLLFFNHFLKI